MSMKFPARQTSENTPGFLYDEIVWQGHGVRSIPWHHPRNAFVPRHLTTCTTDSLAFPQQAYFWSGAAHAFLLWTDQIIPLIHRHQVLGGEETKEGQRYRKISDVSLYSRSEGLERQYLTYLR